MANRYLYLTLLAVLGFNAEKAAAADIPTTQGAGEAPRLVVSIAIDQLRTDCLEAFASRFSDKGFRLLLEQGRVFPRGGHPFVPQDHASALAALVTGTTPYYNNIVGMQWLSRETLRPVGCVDDVRFAGLETAQTVSPAALATSTLGDELKVATAGKAVVYGIASDSESAILSAGHAADGALWQSDSVGTWCSSKYYMKKLPQWVRKLNKDTEGRRPNSSVTLAAEQCIVSMGMGQDDTTDLLSLTYDLGGGEQQDAANRQARLEAEYVLLDAELERLIASVEQWLGADRVLFVVTGTASEDRYEPDYDKYRIPTGTFYMRRAANIVNMYLGAVWGQGKYVETVFGGQMFLNHKLLESKNVALADASAKAQEIVAMMSGVRHVYTARQILTGQGADMQKVRNGYCREHSGDLVVEVAPGWKMLDEDSQQTQMWRGIYPDIPIIFYGAGQKAGRTDLPVTTDRVAPTVARAIRIRAPNGCTAEPLF